MTVDVSRSFVGVLCGLAAGVVIAAGSSAGCSSSSAAPATPEASTACPATIDDTVGASCPSDGVVCSPTFPCGIATVTVRCTCTLGTFQCVDGSGNPFTAGETPACGDAAPALPACPASEGAASVGTCTKAQSGQQCAYPPECMGGTLAYDRCTCEPVPNASSFAWDCENACNSGTGPLPEGGSSSGGDAGTDAEETGSSSDAAADVASDVASQ